MDTPPCRLLSLRGGARGAEKAGEAEDEEITDAGGLVENLSVSVARSGRCGNNGGGVPSDDDDEDEDITDAGGCLICLGGGRGR
jgi:hypothetical protein